MLRSTTLTPTTSRSSNPPGERGESPAPLAETTESAIADIRPFLEQEWANNAAYFGRSLRRWARKEWPGNPGIRHIDPRYVWGLMLSRAIAYLAYNPMAKEQDAQAGE